jgi:hypothetical protein
MNLAQSTRSTLMGFSAMKDEVKPTRSFVFGFTIIFAVLHCAATWMVLYVMANIEEEGASGVFDYFVLGIRPIVLAPLLIMERSWEYLAKTGIDVESSGFGRFINDQFIWFTILNSLVLGFCLSYVLPALRNRFAQR